MTGFGHRKVGRSSPERRTTRRPDHERNGVKTMGLILLVLLLALLFGAGGFALHWLWIIAVVVFIAWLAGFGLARGESAGGGRTRWYRW
jgi:fatty acid desaturase